MFVYFYFLNLYFVLGIFWSQNSFLKLKKILNDDESSIMTNLGNKTEGWDQQRVELVFYWFLLCSTAFYSFIIPEILELRVLGSYEKPIRDSPIYRTCDPFWRGILYLHITNLLKWNAFLVLSFVYERVRRKSGRIKLGISGC